MDAFPVDDGGEVGVCVDEDVAGAQVRVVQDEGLFLVGGEDLVDEGGDAGRAVGDC